ncbi:MAG: ferrous iron transport protein A [Myxococcales bacterium]|nr:ferrous iron transport protein A [Myxococcales bacterium]
MTHVKVASSTLADLTVGERAVVLRLADYDEEILRLMEMGVTPGTAVTLERVAPLGDPLYFALRGYRLAIRRAEARRVEIERVPEAVAALG